jgi:hypothetical protein
MNKTYYSIVAIVMVMTLGLAVATSNAFALSQSSTESAGQATGQSQLGLSILSPQISVQGVDQSTNQEGCLFESYVCG